MALLLSIYCGILPLRNMCLFQSIKIGTAICNFTEVDCTCDIKYQSSRKFEDRMSEKVGLVRKMK